MATNNPSKASAEKVTVACKLPSGLVLQLAKKTQVREPLLGGGSREVDQWHRHGEAVTIFGPSHPQNEGPRCIIVGGYALTPNVNRDFWEAWLAQNAELAAVKNHLIFAYDSLPDAQAAAKEHAALRSGLERIDPNKLPKGLKSLKEETADADA